MSVHKENKAVTLDVDSALVSTVEDIADAMNTTLASYGYPMRSLREYRQWVGLGTRNVVAKAVPKGPQYNDLHSDFMAVYLRKLNRYAHV